MTKILASSKQVGRDPVGRDATSPWQMPPKAWLQVAKRTWDESSKDNVGLVAAGVAFYGFLALVPLLGAIILTYGIIADPQAVIRHATSLMKVLPREVAGVIGEQLMNVVQTSGGKKGVGLILALVVALWGARNSAGALISALNIAYEEEEKRGFLKVTALALLMTVAAVLIALLAIAAATMLGALQHLLPDLGAVGRAGGHVIVYVLLAVSVGAAVSVLYRYAPSRDRPRWEWISPGSFLATLSWLVLTIGFGFYTANFGNYDAAYGALSAVIVLLTWMYLSAYALIFSAEFNSELEHQTARDTTEGAQKPLGARGAWAADHVAAGSETGSADAIGAEMATEAGPPLPVAPPTAAPPADASKQPGARRYVASRVVSRANPTVGANQIGMVSSILATVALGLMRRRGHEKYGAALLVGAGVISFARRG